MEKPIRINELLDEARDSLGLKNDSKLAQALDLPRQYISFYRLGERRPDAYACTKIAQALNRDPLEVIAMIESVGAKNEKERAFWRSFKFCGTRNSYVWLLSVMLAFLGVGSTGGSAEAATAVSSHNGGLRKRQRRRHRRGTVGRRACDRLAA